MSVQPYTALARDAAELASKFPFSHAECLQAIRYYGGKDAARAALEAFAKTGVWPRSRIA